MEHKLKLSLLEGRFGICRLEKDAEIPAWAYGSNFFSVTRTLDELSIVCQEKGIPADIRAEREWDCLKIEGPLDFGLTGILAGLTKILADCGISIFAVSTYDTDYILVREKDIEKTIKALMNEGYTVERRT